MPLRGFEGAPLMLSDEVGLQRDGRTAVQLMALGFRLSKGEIQSGIGVDVEVNLKAEWGISKQKNCQFEVKMEAGAG